MQPTSVSEGWFDTVVLLSLLRTPGAQDVLTPGGFWKAVSSIGEACPDGRSAALLRARIERRMKARLDGEHPGALEAVMAGVELSLAKLPAAFEAYERMAAGLAPVLRQIEALSGAARKGTGRPARGRKGQEEEAEERNEAADRLSRLQERHDRARSEFRAAHFPALFLPDPELEEALAGRAVR
jgi:hypothetical protein